VCISLVQWIPTNSSFHGAQFHSRLVEQIEKGQFGEGDPCGTSPCSCRICSINSGTEFVNFSGFGCLIIEKPLGICAYGPLVAES